MRAVDLAKGGAGSESRDPLQWILEGAVEVTYFEEAWAGGGMVTRLLQSLQLGQVKPEIPNCVGRPQDFKSLRRLHNRGRRRLSLAIVETKETHRGFLLFILMTGAPLVGTK